MTLEQQSETIRNQVQTLANQFIQQSNPVGWFDVLYQKANGDSSQIPWAKMTVNPILADWIEKNKPLSKEKTALVIGCGLGDDGEFLAEYGYQVTAFDISPTAINWCKNRFTNTKVSYLIGDILAENNQWQHKFDLVFESRNIQALPLNIREKVIANIAKFVNNQGTLLVISSLRDTETEPDGPPWPLSETELNQLKKLGFQELNRILFEENSLIYARIEYQFYQ
jgi:SAM-dependent methyltransferase